MPLSRHWVRNARVSWGCILYQDAIKLMPTWCCTYSNACPSSDHVEIRGSPFAETIDITQFECEVAKGGRGYHDHCFHRESGSSKFVWYHQLQLQCIGDLRNCNCHAESLFFCKFHHKKTMRRLKQMRRKYEENWGYLVWDSKLTSELNFKANGY